MPPAPSNLPRPTNSKDHGGKGLLDRFKMSSIRSKNTRRRSDLVERQTDELHIVALSRDPTLVDLGKRHSFESNLSRPSDSTLQNSAHSSPSFPNVVENVDPQDDAARMTRKSSLSSFGSPVENKVIRVPSFHPPALPFRPQALGPLVRADSSDDGQQSVLVQPTDSSTLSRPDLRKKRSISESFLTTSVQRSPSRARSPLDELIVGLGGRRGNESDSDGLRIDTFPSALSAPAMQARTHSHQAQILSTDVDYQEHLQDQSDFDLTPADERLQPGSAWSVTNSARSSRATGMTRVSSPEPPDLAPLATSQDSPVDPHLNRTKHQSLQPERRPMDSDLVHAADVRGRKYSNSSRRWSMSEIEQSYMRMKDMLASAHGSLSASMFSRPEVDGPGGIMADRTPTMSASEVLWRDPSRLPLEQRREISADRFWAAAAEGFVSQSEDTPRIDAQLATFASKDIHSSEEDPDTPVTFVTTFSDLQDQALATPDLGSVYSTSSSPEIDRRASELGNVKKHASTSTISRPPVMQRKQTSDSAVTASSVANDGWQTPRTSVARTVSAHSSNEYIQAWLPRVMPVNDRSSGTLATGRKQHSKNSASRNRWDSAVLQRVSSSESSNHTLSKLPSEPRSRQTTGQSHLDRQPQTITEDAATWFADTPSRTKIRQRQGIPPRMLKQHSRKGSDASLVSSHVTSSPTAASSTLSQFREADKIELFLRFTQTTTELEALRKQSQIEREALLDALNETRSVVHDLRQQRNDLQDQVKQQKAVLSRKSVGPEASNNERVAALVRSKTLWQERAQAASDELERNRKSLDDMHASLLQALDREEEAKNEVLLLGARNTSLTAQLSELQAQLRQKGDDQDTTIALSKPATNGSSRTESSSYNGNLSPRSALPANFAKTPSRLPAPRQRYESSNSSLAGFDGLDVSGTPLMSTKPTFSETPAPRRIGSPTSRLPTRTSPASASKTGIPRMSGGGNTPRLRSPSMQTTANTTHSRKASLSSIASPSSPISVTGIPEEHVRRSNGTTWSYAGRGHQVGLSASDEKYLTEGFDK